MQMHWILERTESDREDYKPVLAEKDPENFVLAAVKVIINDMRDIDDDDKYCSECYYACYRKRVRHAVIAMMASEHYNFLNLIDQGRYNYRIVTSNEAPVDAHNAKQIEDTIDPHPDVGSNFLNEPLYREYSMMQIQENRDILAHHKVIKDKDFLPSDAELNEMTPQEVQDWCTRSNNFLMYYVGYGKQPVLSFKEWETVDKKERDKFDAKYGGNSLHNYHIMKQQQSRAVCDFAIHQCSRQEFGKLDESVMSRLLEDIHTAV